MKKMLFSAIAMVAFSVNSQAQTGIISIDISDVLDCSTKSIQHADKEGPVNSDVYNRVRKAYYQGCVDAKKKDNGSNAHTQQEPTISK